MHSIAHTQAHTHAHAHPLPTLSSTLWFHCTLSPTAFRRRSTIAHSFFTKPDFLGSHFCDVVLKFQMKLQIYKTALQTLTKSNFKIQHFSTDSLILKMVSSYLFDLTNHKHNESCCVMANFDCLLLLLRRS